MPGPRRDLYYAHEGAVRHRRHEDHTTHALCLTVVANAIVAWTREYLGLAVAELRASGRQVDEKLLALISPAHNENVGFYQTFSFDVDRELAALAEGYRLLRQARR
jgi:hypothetical protein